MTGEASFAPRYLLRGLVREGGVDDAEGGEGGRGDVVCVCVCVCVGQPPRFLIQAPVPDAVGLEDASDLLGRALICGRRWPGSRRRRQGTSEGAGGVTIPGRA